MALPSVYELLFFTLLLQQEGSFLPLRPGERPKVSIEREKQ